MAEAIGLAFGGIALTGLVSSCVDILEYTNNARYWMCDLSLALTKVALLQCRLEHLREMHFVAKTVLYAKGSDHLGALGPAFHCNTATQGLSGVKSILEQTNRLCRRYSFTHIAEEGKQYSAAHRSEDLQSPSIQDTQVNQLALAASKPWQRLGRQICWALQDKKKFDKLILDFDFLLSNTEQLFERTSLCSNTTHQQRSSASISHTPSYNSKSSRMSDTDTAVDQDSPSTTVLRRQRSKISQSSRNSERTSRPVANTTQRRAEPSSLPPKTCETSGLEQEPLPPVSRMSKEENHSRDISNNLFNGNNIGDYSGISIKTQDEHGRQGPVSASNNTLKDCSGISVGDDNTTPLRLELAKLNSKNLTKAEHGDQR